MKRERESHTVIIKASFILGELWMRITSNIDLLRLIMLSNFLQMFAQHWTIYYTDPMMPGGEIKQLAVLVVSLARNCFATKVFSSVFQTNNSRTGMSWTSFVNLKLDFEYEN